MVLNLLNKQGNKEISSSNRDLSMRKKCRESMWVAPAVCLKSFQFLLPLLMWHKKKVVRVFKNLIDVQEPSFPPQGFSNPNKINTELCITCKGGVQCLKDQKEEQFLLAFHSLLEKEIVLIFIFLKLYQEDFRCAWTYEAACTIH